MDPGLSHGVDNSHTNQGTFACQTCAIAFYTPDLQRLHYKSDWHRYNLKRRVANLTSVSATTFAEKVLAQQTLAAVTLERANFSEKCGPCGKIYYSENAFNNHLGSKKHKDTVKAAVSKTSSVAALMNNDDDSTHGSEFSLEDSIEPSQTSIYESSTASPAPELADPPSIPTPQSEEDQIRAKLEAAVKLPLGECVFCRTVSSGSNDEATLLANVQHMKQAHSLFIPDAEYLTDLRGLVEYLQEKVSIGNTCLACNKEFRNLEACRAHMASLSHRRIAYAEEDEQLELVDFYDFPGADDEWDDVDGENDDDDDNEELVTGDDDDDDDVAIADDFELRLPSGAVAGHRSLARYYRQNLRGRDPYAANGGSAVHKAIMDRTQAARQELVANSIAGVDSGRKQWSRKHVATFTDMRRREDFKTRVGYKANNHKHHRDFLLQ